VIPTASIGGSHVSRSKDRDPRAAIGCQITS
jgi:hypothetical protein